MSKINTIKNTSGKELYNYQKIAIEEIFQRFNNAPDDYHLLYQLPTCLLYTSPSPRDRTRSRMPSSA